MQLSFIDVSDISSARGGCFQAKLILFTLNFD